MVAAARGGLSQTANWVEEQGVRKMGGKPKSDLLVFVVVVFFFFGSLPNLLP